MRFDGRLQIEHVSGEDDTEVVRFSLTTETCVGPWVTCDIEDLEQELSYEIARVVEEA